MQTDKVTQQPMPLRLLAMTSDILIFSGRPCKLPDFQHKLLVADALCKAVSLWRALAMPSCMSFLRGRVGLSTFLLVCISASGPVSHHLLGRLRLMRNAGTSTQQMQILVNNDNLAEICDRIGLTACINLDPAVGGIVVDKLEGDDPRGGHWCRVRGLRPRRRRVCHGRPVSQYNP